MSKCRSCAATIKFAPTPLGKQIPLDAEPSIDGNVAIIDGVAHVRAKGGLQLDDPPDALLYHTHFVTCPNAVKHRKR